MSEAPPPGDPGDVGALIEELIERIRPRVRKILARHRVPHQEGEDIVQEAWIAAFRYWSGLRSPEHWVLTIIRRRCALYWRDRRQSRLQAVDPDFLAALAPEVAPAQERLEMHWDLTRLSTGLEERHWQLVLLRYRDGRSTAECAEALGYNPSSVRKLSSRALAKLSRRLEESRASTCADTKSAR